MTKTKKAEPKCSVDVTMKVDGLLDVPKRDFDAAVETVEEEIRALAYPDRQPDEGDCLVWKVGIEGDDLWECRDHLQEILDQIQPMGEVHSVTVDREITRDDIRKEIERDLTDRIDGDRQVSAVMQETNCTKKRAQEALGAVAATLRPVVA